MTLKAGIAPMETTKHSAFIIFFAIFTMGYRPLDVIPITKIKTLIMYSRLSRRYAARGSCTSLVTVGPTKV